MSKLIYAATRAQFEAKKPQLGDIDKSMVFMEDGYFWTHGKFFKLYRDELKLFTVDETGKVVKFTDSNGEEIGTLERIKSISGTAPITVSTNAAGISTISHAGKADASTIGPTANAVDSINVPQITFDKFGHYSSVINRTAKLDHVLTTLGASAADHFLVGSDSNTGKREGLVKAAKISFVPSSGVFKAVEFQEGGKTLSALYAPISHVSVIGGSEHGHVKLSDSTSLTSGASGGIAATPTAIKAVMDYAKSLLASNDAMVFMGTMASTGVISGKPEVNGKKLDVLTGYSAGWTIKAEGAVTIAGVGTLEPGDMIVAVKDIGVSYAASDWTVIQANIDGAVTTNESVLTNNNLILGSNGRSIKKLANGANGYFLTSNGGVPTWTSKTFNSLIVGGAKFSAEGTNALSEVIFGTSLTASLAAGKITVNHDNYTQAQAVGLRALSFNAQGHITGFGDIVTALPTKESLTFYNGATALGIFNGGSALGFKMTGGTDVTVTGSHASNVSTYNVAVQHRYRPISYAPTLGGTVASIYSNSQSSTLTIAPGNANITMAMVDGQLRISSKDTNINTWRDVLVSTNGAIAASIGQTPLKFGSEFLWSANEVKLGWTEISSSGTITYSV